MMYSIKSLVDANTLQTSAKRVLLSVCRVQLSICKYKQKFGFTATKGNIISNIMHFCVYTGLISRGNTLLLKTNDLERIKILKLRMSLTCRQ